MYSKNKEANKLIEEFMLLANKKVAELFKKAKKEPGVYRIHDVPDKEKLKALKFTTLITAGLALVLLVLKNTLFDFSGAADGRYIEAYGPNFISALKADRISFFTSDTIRTLVLVLLAAGAIYLYLKEKLSEKLIIKTRSAKSPDFAEHRTLRIKALQTFSFIIK